MLKFYSKQDDDPVVKEIDLVQLERALARVEEQLYRKSEGGGIGSQHSMLSIYVDGETLVEIEEHLTRKSTLEKCDGSATSAFAKVQGTLQDFAAEIGWLLHAQGHSINRASSGLDLIAGIKSLTKPRNTSGAENQDAEVLGSATRRALPCLAARLCVETDTLFVALEELLHQFISKHVEHHLLHRYWGSMEQTGEVRKNLVFYSLYTTCSKH